MPRPDTGNFDKFLTSLGLLLLGAALVVPYFFFNNTDTLMVPAKQLDALTEVGRAALLDRQHSIVWLEPVIAAASVAIGLGGLVMVVIGALRLRAAQRGEDEESTLRRRRARLEVEEMSPAEREERASEQAKVEVGEEDREVEELPRLSVDPDFRASAIARISTGVANVFRGESLGAFNFRPQVRIGTKDREIRVDGVFEDAGSRRDVVMKLRVSPSLDSLKKSERNTTNELLTTLVGYTSLTGQVGEGWLVVVIPMESVQAIWPTELEAVKATLQSSVDQLGKVSIIHERHIDQLPGEFERLFNT